MERSNGGNREESGNAPRVAFRLFALRIDLAFRFPCLWPAQLKYLTHARLSFHAGQVDAMGAKTRQQGGGQLLLDPPFRAPASLGSPSTVSVCAVHLATCSRLHAHFVAKLRYDGGGRDHAHRWPSRKLGWV